MNNYENMKQMTDFYMLYQEALVVIPKNLIVRNVQQKVSVIQSVKEAQDIVL